MKGFKVLFAAVVVIAALQLISFTDDNQSKNIDATIRFDNEQVYFVGRPIVVKFELSNHTGNAFYFELSDDLLFNIDFKILTSFGEPVPYSRDYILAKSTREKVFTRTILLSSDQAVSYLIDISRWFDFKESGSFFIQGVFYPSVDRDTMLVTKNILKLQLNPAKELFPSEKVEQNFENAQNLQLTLKDLPPYKIVEYALEARIKRDWERYFAFFDFDSYIPLYAKYRVKYAYASEQDRLAIIEDFKKERIAEFYNDLLHYEILKTVIEGEKATVSVYLEYKYKNVIEKFNGEYDLVLKNQVWLIAGYILVPVH